MVKLKRLYFGIFQPLKVRKTIILIHPLTKDCRMWHRKQCNNFQLSKHTHPPMQRPKISLFIALNQAIPHNKLWLYSNLPQFYIYQKSATFWAAFRQQGAIMEVTSDSRLWNTVLYRRKSEDTNLTSHTSKTIVTLVWALRNDQPMCQHDGSIWGQWDTLYFKKNIVTWKHKTMKACNLLLIQMMLASIVAAKNTAWVTSSNIMLDIRLTAIYPKNVYWHWCDRCVADHWATQLQLGFCCICTLCSMSCLSVQCHIWGIVII